MKTNWHTLSSDEAARRLNSDVRSGLSSAEAARRLAEYGPNAVTEGKRRTPLVMFLDQFRDFMILVLIAAAVISGFIGEPADTVAIVVIVVLNAVMGFLQEYKAEKAMEALKVMAAHNAKAVRDGGELTVPAADLVPGDLVMLEAGDVVPADLRLVEAHNLRVDESALTGESVPAEKSDTPILDADLPLGDRLCLAYKGTVVSHGRGTGLVTATGMATELGRIAVLIQQEEESRTPLQKRLSGFGRRLSLAILAICAVIFAAGLLRGEPAVQMFLTAVSLAVAAIPESLPAVVTISLALGAGRMVRKDALIRRLPAVETLGSVTYVCTDKTGTITQNRMTVKEYFTAGPTQKILEAMALCNDARPGMDGVIKGDPTEAALYGAAHEAGYDKRVLEEKYPRVAEVPFDSGRKMMSTLHIDPAGGYLLITKGALENVIASSGAVDGDAVLKSGEQAAAEGMRLMAFGIRNLDALPGQAGPGLEKGLTFLGFVGLMDPPREGVKQAVSECLSAGVRVVMVTGDHPATAFRIARDMGICSEQSEVMSGGALKKIAPGDLEDIAGGITVYARVAPEQKLDIVRALQGRGHIVAMTGDGVNDAPALKKADIGVAMGVAGTDVAREASDMVLLDDNFASIVNAIREGRRIYDNIRKFIRYIMASNAGEILVLFLAPFFGLPMPLLPIHILWINLVTDGLPGLSLAVEPEEKGVMARPPRDPGEGIFSRGLGWYVVWVGTLMGVSCILVQAWALRTGHAHWQGMVFTVLCLSQMGHVLAVRSETESFFTQGMFGNIPLLLSVILTFALQMATLYVPFLNPVFKTEPLSAAELGITLMVSSVVFIAVEAEKYTRRTRFTPLRGTSGMA